MNQPLMKNKKGLILGVAKVLAGEGATYQNEKTGNFVIPCKRSATRNPVLSIVSWITAFAGKTIRVVIQSSCMQTIKREQEVGYEI